MSQFEKSTDKALASLNRSLKLIAEYGEADPNILASFTKTAEQILTINQKYNNHSQALGAASVKSYEEFDETYKQELNNSTSENVQESAKFKKFENDAKAALVKQTEVGASTAEQVDEDMAVQNEISNLDPITKKPIKCAVRNRQCNHIYDKDVVAESLSFNNRLRCPIMGCGNKNFVTMADLVEDKKLQQLFDSMQMQESDSE